ncbi:MAG TPA: XdhC family protein [Solirubrobacteraceae bacterium]|nr:XdhC family protein [Solirubrobacteraceae bacterium]
MRSDALARRAEELAAQGAAFATATVVRAQRPTSAHAGDVALITSDGNIEGFVGGICAEHSVRLFAWTVMKSGKPLLLRILPEVGDDERSAVEEDGAVTVENTCLSGGAIEIFLEPTLPTPRVNVVGSKPIAAALERLGPEFDLDVAAVGDDSPQIQEGDLAVVVAAHGKGELDAIRAGLEADLPYVGLVASPTRGSALLEELREAGVPEEQLARVDCPAGLDIGAQTPSEVALSIIASLIQTRYGGAYTPPLRAPSAQAPPSFAVDPICGMTVTMAPDTPHLEHEGETVWFCREGCKSEYEAQLSGSTAEAPAGAGPATAVDPICGMTVLATADTPQLEHGGETVYFCCDACRTKYQQEHLDAVAAG